MESKQFSDHIFCVIKLGYLMRIYTTLPRLEIKTDGVV